MVVTATGDLLSCYKIFAGDALVKLVFMMINWKKLWEGNDKENNLRNIWK